MKIIVSILLIFSFFISSSQKIDIENSFITFSAKHMQNKVVEGTIKGFKGEIKINKNNIITSVINISADVSTINTGFVRRDTTLSGKSFLNAEKYPLLTFKSTSFEQIDKGYITTGELTIKEITEEVSIPFTVFYDGRKTILKGSFTINRFDFELCENISTITVSENIDIKIECVIKNKKKRN